MIVMGVAVDDVRHVLLKDSQNWGAYEAIISAQRHAITTVRAYTFLQVVSISRESLASLPEKEPDLKGAFTRVRVWAFTKPAAIRCRTSRERLQSGVACRPAKD